MKIRKILTLRNLYAAYKYKKKHKKDSVASKNLQLWLYSKILKTRMLHLGYFEDPNIEPENISIKQIEKAQIHYAEKIITKIKNSQGTVLDVGCGMGGLSDMIIKKGHQVEALTPDKHQKSFITKEYPNLICHQTKFEDFTYNHQYDTIINSESLQYIDLDIAFQRIDKMLNKGGQWIVIDYFRVKKDTINKSGHLLSDFQAKIKKYGFEVTYQEDITSGIMPTLKYIHMYADRFLNPLLQYAQLKLQFKNPFLFKLTEGLRESINAKVKKEIAAIHPDYFMKEKKYILITLEKNQPQHS